MDLVLFEYSTRGVWVVWRIVCFPDLYLSVSNRCQEAKATQNQRVYLKQRERCGRTLSQGGTGEEKQRYHVVRRCGSSWRSPLGGTKDDALHVPGNSVRPGVGNYLVCKRCIKVSATWCLHFLALTSGRCMRTKRCRWFGEAVSSRRLLNDFVHCLTLRFTLLQGSETFFWNSIRINICFPGLYLSGASLCPSWNRTCHGISLHSSL